MCRGKMLATFETFSADHYSAALGQGRPLQINLATAPTGRIKFGGADAIRITAPVQTAFLARRAAFHRPSCYHSFK